MTQSEIAASVKLNQGTVSRFLDELSRDWLVEGVFNFNEAKIEQLHKINALEVEYWDAWQRSIGLKKENTVVDRTISSHGLSIPSNEKRTKSWRDVGDPRYLAGVQWCIEQRAKLLGLYEEVKVGGSAFNSLSDWIRVVTENATK